MLPAAPTVAVGLLTAALAGTSVAAADDDDARAAAAASAGDDAALVCEDAIVCRRFHQKLKGFNLYLASSTSSRGTVPVFTRYRYAQLYRRPILLGCVLAFVCCGFACDCVLELDSSLCVGSGSRVCPVRG